VKLTPPADKPIDTLIINGCECEPMLTADFRLMMELAPDIVEGALVMKKILNAAAVVFALEADRAEAAKLLKELAADTQAQVRTVRSIYPMGSENQLIYALLGRRVPMAGLPCDVGCVVQNVATAAAVAQAVKYGKSFIDRVITVAGDNVNQPKNVRVRFGTPAIEVIDFCGGYLDEPGQIIFGGPMMGTAQYSEQVPVIKGTTAIIVNRTGNDRDEGPCVRCAHCVDVCPARLLPCELASLAEHRKFDACRDYSIFECIECGCCAYVCPTQRKLVHHIRFGKAELTRQESTPR
jgi:electron transport complex protein RnfC